MSVHTPKTLSLLCLFTLGLAAACSDDSGTAADTKVLQDLGLDQAQVDQAVDGAQTPDSAGADGSSAAGKATDVKLGLHDNEVKIQLATMTVVGKEATTWDLYMAHDNGPNMYLGPGVTGQSLGSATKFHDVDTAPDTGYEADDTTSGKLVIGISWRSGGSGTTGFTMNGNVYVVQLADKTYAKLEVLSAKSGEIHVLCYRQADGSKSLKTEP
jgi:hypothetical protein